MSTPEQRRIYCARYYAKHRDRILAKNRATYHSDRERQRARSRAYYEAHRDRERERHYRRLYGIAPEEYERLLADQGGACAICRRTPRGRLHVDHDHDSGTVRGLLCAGCNSGLGNLGDAVAGLERALRYLRAAP